MFNFFKFKTEDEFIASVSEIKKKLKNEIMEEIKESTGFDLIIGYGNYITRPDLSMMIGRYFNDHDEFLQKRLKDEIMIEINSMEQKNKILESKIETILSVLRVNAKIED